jgi:hypothetical protein
MNIPFIFYIIFYIRFKNNAIKKDSFSEVTENRYSNKESICDNFLLGQPMYDMTPPPPLPFPKLYHYALEPSRHYQHKYSSSFLNSLKPLTIGCDIGLPVDELILYSK